MHKNPFISESFKKVWSKHFNQSKSLFVFSFIKDIAFVKDKYLPYYINVGNKLTNGITYKLEDQSSNDYTGKVFLIRDLPSYHELERPKSNRLKLKKVFQYGGYITNVKDFDSLDAYLKTIYKSNSRSKLRRNISRLESCFSTQYKMYYGNISKAEFDFVFKVFYKLLEKRYSEKREPCGELKPEIWCYYSELAYKMINEKTASLFVIYSDNIPIGITFSYHFGNILIEALTVFDIDFYRFNIGHTTILKMLEWSFENSIQIFDYTQGEFEYKKRWSNDTYQTFFYILYDSKSIKSIVLSRFLMFYFNTKRIFREQKLNNIYHGLKHRLFPSYKTKKIKFKKFEVISIIENIPNFESLEPFDLQSDDLMYLRRALFEFLYKNPEAVSEFNFFKAHDELFYMKGEKNILKIFSDD